MLNVKPIKQSISQCGPSCLKMVFDYYNKTISLNKISKIAKTSLRYGTSNQNMVLTARYFGFDAEYKEESNFDELQDLVVLEKIPVIICWFSHLEKHYSVVVGMDNKKIYFIDPEDGYGKKMSLKFFKKLWFDFDGDYIKSKNNLRLRPIIVIKPN